MELCGTVVFCAIIAVWLNTSRGVVDTGSSGSSRGYNTESS